MKLLMKKTSQGGSAKNVNTIAITRTTISIRSRVIESLDLNTNCSGAIGYNEAGELCLYHKKTPYTKFYSMSTTDEKTKPLNYLRIAISKNNRKEMEPVIGTYVVQKTHGIGEGIFESKLKKLY